MRILCAILLEMIMGIEKHVTTFQFPSKEMCRKKRKIFVFFLILKWYPPFFLERIFLKALGTNHEKKIVPPHGNVLYKP